MRLLVLFILITLVSFESISGEYVVDTYGPYRMTQVSRYLNGDTFEGWVSNFIYQTVFVRVRIRGISAPDKNGSTSCERLIAEKSKKFLMALLENSSYVMLDNLKYDSLGRVLASVKIDKGDVGSLMIAKGLAHPYKPQQLSWCLSG